MKLVLPVIVVSQFLCTSMWFAGNAVMPDLVNEFNLNENFLAHLTTAVQFGFVAGTFFFALFSLADRYSPTFIFLLSSIVAAAVNLGIAIPGIGTFSLISFRFFTGFFLAGIYPVGMKIASDHYKEGLGRSLGFLVGALVLGTALPHLLKTMTISLPWKFVVYSTSALAIFGGALLFIFVKDGPHRNSIQQINFKSFLSGFRNRKFRSISMGYFGHMWELYTFWAFVPVILVNYNKQFPQSELNISLLSFIVIGTGSLACIVSGILSQSYPSKKIARLALICSGSCCIISPIVLQTNFEFIFILFLIFWGIVVIADSPLFSSLIAKNSPPHIRGTSLTIVNCIGFSITIISIQFINFIADYVPPAYLFLFLAIGPLIGVISLFKSDPADR